MLFEFETNLYEKDTNKLYSDEEGLIKGNLFPKLYESYKNYRPLKINPKSERDAMLLKIMELDFALNDLNLYLAIHPDDMKCYELFKKYSLAYRNCVEEYESKYQVLELTHDTYGKYTWGSNPWPWEDDYV